MLGRVTELHAPDQLPRPLRLEHLVERAPGVRVQIVAHHDHFLARRVTAFQQARHFRRPVGLGPGRPHAHLTPARQRFGEHEDVGRARAFVFVVDPLAVVLRRRDRRARLLQKLHRLLVHAEHRAGRIMRPGIGVEHLFHACDELGVGLGRDDPVFDLPMGHATFFKVRRTVSWLIGSRMLNSTTFRASRRKLQLA